MNDADDDDDAPQVCDKGAGAIKASRTVRDNFDPCHGQRHAWQLRCTSQYGPAWQDVTYRGRIRVWRLGARGASIGPRRSPGAQAASRDQSEAGGFQAAGRAGRGLS